MVRTRCLQLFYGDWQAKKYFKIIPEKCHTGFFPGFIGIDSYFCRQFSLFIPTQLSVVALSTNRNFGLTPDQFEALTERLRQGDESLFETLFLKHFKYCQNILIRKYKAPHEEAYDSVMWAMLRMRQLLLDNKVEYGNLESYMVRMSVNKYLKKQERNREISVEILPETMYEQDDRTDAETMGILNRAWQKMGDKCQELLKGFYYDKIELKQLTTLLGDTSEANTRKKKERCLIELRAQFFRFYQA